MAHPPAGLGDELMTPGEVAAVFQVAPKTVTRWAREGRLPSVRTPGGRHRHRAVDVRALVEKNTDRQ